MGKFIQRVCFFGLLSLGLVLIAARAIAGSEEVEVARIQAAMWSYVAFAISITIVKVVSLVLGYFVAKLGYTTMMTGVQGKDSVELQAFGSKLKFKGVTPGLALGIVGVLMMGWALSTMHHFSSEVNTRSVEEQGVHSQASQNAEGRKEGSELAPKISQ